MKVSIAVVVATLACAGPLLPAGRAVGQGVDGPRAAESSSGLPQVENFFRRAKYSDVRLSPDGKLLSAIVPLNERRNLALIDLDKGSVVALTALREQDVASYSWIGDRILEIRIANLADESGLVILKQDVLIDVTGQVVRDMTKVSQRGLTRIVATLDHAGDDLIIENVDRNLHGYDAYRYNPRTGEKKLLTFQSPGNVTRFVADHAGQIRIAVSVPKGGTRTILFYRRGNDDPWVALRDDLFDEESIKPIAFDFDNKTLLVYAHTQENGGRNDVYAFDPETNQLGTRLSDARDLDAGRVVFDYAKQKPVGVGDGSRSGVHWIDPEWNRLQQSIDATLSKTRNVIGWGRYDTSRVIVSTESETQPPIFYLLDRTTLKMQEVAVAYPWLKEGDLSPRRFVRYKARDGLSIPAYLTMPTKPDGSKPPLIVDIHGGPFVGPTAFGYSAEAQLFASRGYAVLQPDYRGSKGYGDAFYKAGWKQYGLAMQDDVTDGVKWLVETGKVDPDRVCLFGGSYGGYATLWGLEKEPGMFRCGVAFVALADLELKFDVGWSDYMKAEWGNNATNMMMRTVGDPDRDREKMRAVSPLYHADRIQAPLLLAYGASDQRVPLIHGNRMRSALDKNNKPYEWVVYADEGHGFNKDENRFDFYRRVDAFLAKNLAPRAKTGSASSAPAVSAAAQ